MPVPAQTEDAPFNSGTLFLHGYTGLKLIYVILISVFAAAPKQSWLMAQQQPFRKASKTHLTQQNLCLFAGEAAK